MSRAAPGVALDSSTRWAIGSARVWLPLDIRIDDHNVFVPDLLWYAEGREVRSPSTRRYDVGAKMRGYEHHGLPQLWLVDTAADELLAFRRCDRAAAAFDVALELGRGDTLGSSAMAGFVLELDVLFAPQAD